MEPIKGFTFGGLMGGIAGMLLVSNPHHYFFGMAIGSAIGVIVGALIEVKLKGEW